MPDTSMPAPTPKPAPAPARSAPADQRDQMLHAWQSRFTVGRSPSTLALAFMDWSAHLANAPFGTATSPKPARCSCSSPRISSIS